MSYLQNSQPLAAGDKMNSLMQSVYTASTMVTISDDFKDFENVKRTKVAEPPAVTTLVSVLPVPELLTEDLVSILKVFAILS